MVALRVPFVPVAVTPQPGPAARMAARPAAVLRPSTSVGVKGPTGPEA